jgi:hypothetical protein
MALINKLQQGGSPYSVLNGATPSIPQFADSKLHYEYSINGNPNVPKKPSPSTLDLDGQVPTTNYRDNAPEGRTF